MSEFTKIGAMRFDNRLINFIDEAVLPGSGLDNQVFWDGFSSLLADLAPINSKLLKHREALQQSIDEWHIKNPDFDAVRYEEFLREIGYLVEEGPDFTIETKNCDPEIAAIAGPQLVVPIMNARFALNAANARWGSLYDALYGTNAIEPMAETSSRFQKTRGDKVIAWAKRFLDEHFALQSGSHGDATSYRVRDGGLEVDCAGKITTLARADQFTGHTGNHEAPDSVFLVNHGLHMELCFDRDHPIGKEDRASLSDIKVESAMSSIMDCEDSVAAVDCEDKIATYRNWLGLMKGDLEETFEKAGKTIRRALTDDKSFVARDGAEKSLKGRALMLVRNVGHLMTTPAILDEAGNQMPEGIIDGVITSAIALHDVGKNGRKQNSKTGSIYIVKPKMHGPEEVAFANTLFSRVEALLGLQADTIKIGIMDEERRTTVNLKECIRAVKSRVFFINTGFLDRTGDEIHTSMLSGAMMRKDEMKSAVWIKAYEDWNVDIGLKCGFSGKAQIGKGMWAKPDEMGEMLAQKSGHPNAGANTAWVPSPTAATLHALHYHEVDVFQRQNELGKNQRAELTQLLSIPKITRPNWSKAQIQEELENCTQGILGYVVRWINQGIGCSKVPDIHGVGLMEDRATLRISAQLLANWLGHGICKREQILETMERMAAIVDDQNTADPHYIKMCPDLENSVAFQAACDLVFKGKNQPSGYTEPILHARRLEFKQLKA